MVDSPRRFGFYDGQVFRFDLDDFHGFWPGERWMGDRWERITPSEEEYDHVRRIGPVEAAERLIRDGAPIDFYMGGDGDDDEVYVAGIEI